MYADDTTISYNSNNINIISCNLQNNLSNILKWCALNNMTLNPKKTTCMLIGKNTSLKNVSLNLKLGSSTITQVKSQKVLGITIDETLSWNIQIQNVYSNIKSKIGQIGRAHV